MSVTLFKPAAPQRACHRPRHATLSVTVTAQAATVACPRCQRQYQRLAGSHSRRRDRRSVRLTELLVDVGDKVKKGQLLATLQQDSVAADLAQSRANLAEASAAPG